MKLKSVGIVVWVFFGSLYPSIAKLDVGLRTKYLAREEKWPNVHLENDVPPSFLQGFSVKNQIRHQMFKRRSYNGSLGRQLNIFGMNNQGNGNDGSNQGNSNNENTQGNSSNEIKHGNGINGNNQGNDDDQDNDQGNENGQGNGNNGNNGGNGNNGDNQENGSNENNRRNGGNQGGGGSSNNGNKQGNGNNSNGNNQGNGNNGNIQGNGNSGINRGNGNNENNQGNGNNGINQGNGNNGNNQSNGNNGSNQGSGNNGTNENNQGNGNNGNNQGNGNNGNNQGNGNNDNNQGNSSNGNNQGNGNNSNNQGSGNNGTNENNQGNGNNGNNQGNGNNGNDQGNGNNGTNEGNGNTGNNQGNENSGNNGNGNNGNNQGNGNGGNNQGNGNNGNGQGNGNNQGDDDQENDNDNGINDDTAFPTIAPTSLDPSITQNSTLGVPEPDMVGTLLMRTLIPIGIFGALSGAVSLALCHRRQRREDSWDRTHYAQESNRGGGGGAKAKLQSSAPPVFKGDVFSSVRVSTLSGESDKYVMDSLIASGGFSHAILVRKIRASDSTTIREREENEKSDGKGENESIISKITESKVSKSERLHNLYVIKFPRQGGDGRYARVLRNEIKCQQELKHPNIVSVIDLVKLEVSSRHEGSIRENVAFTMPYADLGSLRSYRNSSLRRMGNKEQKMAIMDIMRQTSAGVFYLHQNNIVHQDLKPDNILMFTSYNSNESDSTEVVAKICDFGLARPVEVTERIVTDVSSSTNEPPRERRVIVYKFAQKFGTKHWAAPEKQIKGQANDPFLADIYSLGKLWQWLHRTVRVPSFSEEMLDSCLNLNPRQRPTIEQLLHHLNNTPSLVSSRYSGGSDGRHEPISSSQRRLSTPIELVQIVRRPEKQPPIPHHDGTRGINGMRSGGCRRGSEGALISRTERTDACRMSANLLRVPDRCVLNMHGSENRATDLDVSKSKSLSIPLETNTNLHSPSLKLVHEPSEASVGPNARHQDISNLKDWTKSLTIEKSSARTTTTAIGSGDFGSSACKCISVSAPQRPTIPP